MLLAYCVHLKAPVKNRFNTCNFERVAGGREASSDKRQTQTQNFFTSQLLTGAQALIETREIGKADPI